MNQSQQPVLPRERVREIFALHRGEAERLAKSLGVSKTTVSQVLRSRATSRRIEEAARARALEIIESEKAERAA